MPLREASTEREVTGGDPKAGKRCPLLRPLGTPVESVCPLQGQTQVRTARSQIKVGSLEGVYMTISDFMPQLRKNRMSKLTQN